MTPTPMPHEGINAFDGRALLVVLLISVCVAVAGLILAGPSPDDVLEQHDEAERVRRETDAGRFAAGDLRRVFLALAAVALILLGAGLLAGCGPDCDGGSGDSQTDINNCYGSD